MNLTGLSCIILQDRWLIIAGGYDGPSFASTGVWLLDLHTIEMSSRFENDHILLSPIQEIARQHQQLDNDDIATNDWLWAEESATPPSSSTSSPNIGYKWQPLPCLPRKQFKLIALHNHSTIHTTCDRGRLRHYHEWTHIYSFLLFAGSMICACHDIDGVVLLIRWAIPCQSRS
jgi:hypothetical protein